MDVSRDEVWEAAGTCTLLPIYILNLQQTQERAHGAIGSAQALHV